MKLPSFKRLNKADFDQKFQDLIDTLSVSLNIGIENLYNAMNHQVSLNDNILCDVKSVTLTVDSTGAPSSSTYLKLTNVTGTPQGLTVISARNLSNTAVYPQQTLTISGTSYTFPAAVGVSYSIDSTGLKLTQVTGIQPNTSYQLTIIVWG